MNWAPSAEVFSSDPTVIDISRKMRIVEREIDVVATGDDENCMKACRFSAPKLVVLVDRFGADIDVGR